MCVSVLIVSKIQQEQLDGVCHASGGKSAGTALHQNIAKMPGTYKTQVLKVISYLCASYHCFRDIKISISLPWKSMPRSLGVYFIMVWFVGKYANL